MIEKIRENLINKKKIAFLDIETTGLSKYNHQITLIGIYDGEEHFVYIENNLKEAINKLKEFEIVVTYNGKQFDVPFIEYHFNEKFDFIHLDLRYLLYEFGLKGGLKNIEKLLGINRNEEVYNIDGFEAVRLWKKYKKGDKKALGVLVKYNYEDVKNLKYILEWYVERKIQNVEKIN